MDKIKNIDKLHISAKKLVEDFSKRIIDAYGGQLKSITVYGSALGSFFNPKKSDVNLLIILDNVSLDSLKKCHPVMKKYGQRINPLILTKEYIQSSQDVYPIEFLEMKENYLSIYGEDVLQDIKVDRQYLRSECEQQLKGNLLKLKQGFLRLGLKRAGIERLMKESISSTFTIFRNLIRIKGEEPPLNKEKIIERMADYYNLDKDTFISILRHKIGFGKIPTAELENYFDKYLRELEKLIDIVDKL